MKWTTQNIPDLTGKDIIITGANSGIGFETALVLALKNAHIVIACRSEERGLETINRIQSKYDQAKVDFIKLDLSELQSVKDFSQEFKAHFNNLNILINNAGIMKTPYQKTIDGFELQFATNYLGHFALTGQLINLLNKNKNSRIVNISSTGHKFAKIEFENLQGEKKYDAQKAYAQSKLANLLFTYELQRRLEEVKSDTIAVAAHPGWTATNLQKHWLLLRIFNPLIGQKPPKGALPSLYAATATNVQGGDYYGPNGWQQLRGYPKKVASSKLSYDKELAKKLWLISEELTEIRFQF